MRLSGLSLYNTGAYVVALLVGAGPLIAFGDPATVSADQNLRGDSTSQNNEAVSVDNIAVELSDDMRTTVFPVIDDIINVFKQMRNTELVEEWQSYRAKLSKSATIEDALNVAANSLRLTQGLRQDSRLLIAHQFIQQVLPLGDAIKQISPSLCMSIHHEAAMIDTYREDYENALSHISIALKTEQASDSIKPKLALACRADHAAILVKMERYDEAEKIYLELIREATEKPAGISNDHLYSLRLALAALYARKGDYETTFQMLLEIDRLHPKQRKRASKSYGDHWRATRMILIRSGLEGSANLGRTAELGQQTVDLIERIEGASSVRYVEAIELLAKVRIAQSRFDDAVALLEKSAVARSKLFGKDHPSIAKLKTEIEAVAKKR